MTHTLGGSAFDQLKIFISIEKNISHIITMDSKELVNHLEVIHSLFWFIGNNNPWIKVTIGSFSLLLSALVDSTLRMNNNK